MTGVGPVAVPVGLESKEAVAAIRDPRDRRVPCPAPGPAHDPLGLLPPKRFRRGPALAAVARSHGERSSYADDIAETRAALANLDAPDPDSDPVSLAGPDRARLVGLRERVARLQGRLRERRERGLDTASVKDRLDEATRRLAGAETDAVAQDQSIRRARERARRVFDVRERRLELQDRLGNLERDARVELAAHVRPAVGDALGRLPGADSSLEAASPTDVAFAAARVGRFDAPIVLSETGPFGDETAAARWLGTDVCYPVRS